MGLEREYAKQIAGLVGGMFRTIKRDVPRMVALVKSNQIKMDADANTDLDEFMEYLASVLLLRQKAEPFVSRMWDKVNRYTDKEIREIFTASSPPCIRAFSSNWSARTWVRQKK